MKTSTIGIVSAAILMVVAGAGIGIAQAGDTNTIGEFMEWQSPEQGSSSIPYLEDRPVLSTEEEMQLRNPTEVGSLPEMSEPESSIVDTEEHNYLGGEDIDDRSKRD